MVLNRDTRVGIEKLRVQILEWLATLQSRPFSSGAEDLRVQSLGYEDGQRHVQTGLARVKDPSKANKDSGKSKTIVCVLLNGHEQNGTIAEETRALFHHLDFDHLYYHVSFCVK